jgi:hypothetical protein
MTPTYWAYVTRYWLAGHSTPDAERLAAQAITRDQRRRERAALQEVTSRQH